MIIQIILKICFSFKIMVHFYDKSSYFYVDLKSQNAMCGNNETLKKRVNYSTITTDVLTN